MKDADKQAKHEKKALAVRWSSSVYLRGKAPLTVAPPIGRRQSAQAARENRPEGAQVQAGARKGPAQVQRDPEQTGKGSPRPPYQDEGARTDRSAASAGASFSRGAETCQGCARGESSRFDELITESSLTARRLFASQATKEQKLAQGPAANL